MQIPVLLDRSRTQALTGQLVAQLRDAIHRDMIQGGTRLPSTRRLAEQLAISRNTAVRAYDILVLEGYAEARPASGIFALKPAGLAAPAPTAEAPDPGVTALPLCARQVLRPSGDPRRLSFDFFPGRSSAALFPLRSWRRLLLARLAQGGAEFSRHGDPGGLFDLRSALSGFLAATRGIVADPARIIITHGAQEALSLAAAVLLTQGATAVIEDPCYAGAAEAFRAAGAALAGVPVDGDGIRADLLPERPASLLYLTPAHQYPTGAVLAMHRRSAVLDWARRAGCMIVEDDYDGDIRYEGAPLPAIASAAPDRTIHVGSFTQTLGAGLRLGYMVVPSALAPHVQAAKARLSHGNAWLDQATLADFIQSGSYSTHLARLRALHREGRDLLLAALARHFGEVDVSGATGGLHLLWTLPPGMPEAATLEALARRARVGIYPLAAAGVHAAAGSALMRRGVLLGYAALTPRQINDGIARLSDAVDDRLDRHHDFLHELMVHEQRPVAPPPPRQPAPSIVRRLALSATERRRPVSGSTATGRDHASMAVVRGIYRYPVKGLSAQPLRGIRLEAGRPFPFDRVFALARDTTRIDPADPRWAKKGLFVMLMLDEALARVRTRLDVATMRLSVTDGEGADLLEADLEDADGREAVELFFQQLTPTLRGRPMLVRSRAGHFMDKPDNVVSLINLATLRSLEERWGYSLDPLRFRANFYIDGARPWAEFDWIGDTLQIGDARLRVDRRNGRCGATNVDPFTGVRDRDLPTALRAAFGHKDLGVYLVVEQSGAIVVGDGVTPLQGVSAPALPAAARPEGRMICRGCYYVHDGVAALPEDWRCPDCGTDVGKLQPYSGMG